MIYQGRGQYDQAIAEFAAVRDRSPKQIEAQTRLGAAHWAKSRMLDRRGDKEKAAAESLAAIDLLEKSLKARRAAGAGPTDAGLIGNAADLAVALTETGKPADALKLLDPISKAQTTRTGASLRAAHGSDPARSDQLRTGRARHRLDEGARTVGIDGKPRPALLQAGQAAGTRTRPPPRKERLRRTEEDAAGLPFVSHGTDGEPVRTDLRVAAMGR